MAWREHTEQGLYALAIAAILGVVAGVRSLIRKIFTNEAQIELMRQQMKSMGEDLHEMKQDNKQLINLLLEKDR
jgi:uncharacterized membrane protein (DUF106 family)